MGFAEAVKTSLSKYATFSGRARRSEFWWFYLFMVIVMMVALVIDKSLGLNLILYVIVALALLIPMISSSVRRLHDTGRSGWWYWIYLVPLIGLILLLVWLVSDSQPEDNEYGPSPKPSIAYSS